MSLKRVSLLIAAMLASLALASPVSATTVSPPDAGRLIASLSQAEDVRAAYNALAPREKEAVDARLKAALDNLPPQSHDSNGPIGAEAVYGPFSTAVSCHASGLAGVLGGLWSYYECWRDTYGLWWLATL